MDFAIQTDGMVGQMTFEKAEAGNLLNNIYLSLMVNKGAFFQNTDFGSRLYLLQRGKNTEKTASLVVEYCKEALQWIIDTGKAVKIDVTTQLDKTQDLNRLKLLVEAYPAVGDKVTFQTFVEVV